MLSKLKFEEIDKKHPLYNTWYHMVCRCYLPFHVGYRDYGGNGILMCDEWLNFSQFAKDVGEVKPETMSLDRIDNKKGYSKENCRWASRSQQMLNRNTFGNNKTGETGVVKIVDRYEARFHYEGVRYRLGRFDNIDSARKARDEFMKLFFKDRNLAISSLPVETVWCTSTTNMRGINKHKDGGYVLRVTVEGERLYLGYFKTLNEAFYARQEFNNKRNKDVRR
jgi:hypothetical protein